ncbi:unnamed protein product [Pylaiella littoralis]
MRRAVLLPVRYLLTFGASLEVAGCARAMDRLRHTASPQYERFHHHRRQLLMQGRTAADEWEASSRNRILDSGIVDVEAHEEAAREGPHPLRTQDWKLEMRSRPWTRREQEVTFHRNGTMSSSDGEKGEWWFDVGGLYWDVNTTIRAAPTVLHHKAELHWNAFGSQPRMFRGTVTRDRLPTSILPPWLFRPVIHSFVGSGVGDDTADTSYRHRQVGAPSGAGGTSPKTDRY